MGKHAQGWKIRQRAPGHAYAVRFTHAGTEYERSTGTADPTEAAREAARIYAEVVRSTPKLKRRRVVGAEALEELIASWTAHIEQRLDAETVKTYELYANTHWYPFFGGVQHLTEERIQQYVTQRLSMVGANTVRKELSALRGFLEYSKVESRVPSIPKRTMGTKYGKARRAAAIELSPEETEAIIEALPVWSTSKRVERFPIRARFRFTYETSLRPSAVDGLSVPEHYRKGRKHLNLTAELDKTRAGRPLPLTDAAREAIDSVCPTSGLIFGRHDYRWHLELAARAVLTSDRADLFCGVHLRSARLTHWCERSKNLAGVQYMAGHKHLSTTAKYVKTSLRAAQDLLEEQSGRE